MSVKITSVRECKRCYYIFSALLSYCPECEAFYNDHDEEDIRDTYDDPVPEEDQTLISKPQN